MSIQRSLTPRRILLTLTVLVMIVGTLYICTLEEPPVKMLSISMGVVNEEGMPVKNAMIQPFALRTYAEPSAHILWPREGDPPVLWTDEEGRADVPYPRYAWEKQRTSRVTIKVEHPEYSPQTLPDLDVKNAETQIVLKRVVTLKVAAWTDDSQHLIQKHIWFFTNRKSLKKGEKGKNGIWCCRGVVPGKNTLLVVHKPEKGPLLFSDLVEFSSESGETLELSLQLKPGVSLKGRLSSAVPRPVKGARVLVHAYPLPQEKPRRVSWKTEGDIAWDGTFEFSSLPRGKAEVIVVMDGWVIENPVEKRGRMTRVPHVVSTELFSGMKHAELIVSMVPAATAEVQVLNPDGVAVSGVSVSFWPNMRWDNQTSSILGRTIPRLEEVIREDGELTSEWWQEHDDVEHRYSAETNDEGLAIIHNLPSTKQASFVADSQAWCLPIKDTGRSKRRYGTMELKSGETVRATVSVIPKGKDFLGEGN